MCHLKFGKVTYHVRFHAQVHVMCLYVFMSSEIVLTI